MTKLASKIATGLAVLALAAPALAAAPSANEGGAAADSTTQAPAHKSRSHKKVAQADTKSTSADAKGDTSAKSEAKGDAAATKKAHKKHKRSSKAKSEAKSEAPAQAPASTQSK